MSGHRCAVFGCNDKPRKSGKRVAYHVFPANKLLRDAWVRMCGGPERINPDRSYICSAHFKEDDYESNLRAKASSWPARFVLKSTAVPSLNLVLRPFEISKSRSNGSEINVSQQIKASSHPNETKKIEELYIDANGFSVGVKTEANETSPESRDQELETWRYNKQEIKDEEIDISDDCFASTQILDESAAGFKDDSDVIFVNEFKAIGPSEASECERRMDDFETGEVSADEFKVFANNNLRLEVGLKELSCAAEEDFTPTNPSSRIRYHVLVQSHNRLLKRVKELENELIVSQSLVAGLQEKVRSLQGELQKAREQAVEDLQLKEGIGGVLSESQINFGLLKKKKVVWTSDDLSKAFTIRYFSLRCYTYLRETLKYPLPGLSSLQRWVSKINLQQGVLSDILQIMKIAGHAMTDFEKTAILCWDEVEVQPLYEYDEIQDEVLGPHSIMHVIMARGLFSDWKQPVYIGFDRRITLKILLDVIERLHDVTYNVVACVTNCRIRDVWLWSELGITSDETSILHPITNSRIYFLVDSAHLLSLIHKSLIEAGFTLEDGTVITKDPLEQLIVGETDTSHGLTAKHLQAEEGRSQNSELAKQVFSRPCVLALTNVNSKSALHLGVFIEKISSWFELMTASSSNLLTNKLYGCDLACQNELLDSVHNLIKTTRCGAEGGLRIFQRGLLISISSLKRLFGDMQMKYSVKHLLTYRLNLDSLEDLLSQVRISGHKRPPSPLSAVYKFRTLLLGNGVNQNSKEVLKNEYILSKVLTFSISIHEPHLTAVGQGDMKMLRSFTEEDHLKYLAAMIATKFKDKYPELVDETGKKRNYILPFWLEHLSCGDLTKASKSWLTHIKQMDKMFTFHHGDEGVLKKKGVTKKLVNYVAKRYKNVFPLEVIKEFVVQRTLIRIMHCNIKLDNKMKGKKRKSKSVGRNVKVKARKNV